MILAEEPKCSARVNLSKQSIRVVGPLFTCLDDSLDSEISEPPATLKELSPPTLLPQRADVPRSNEMSQKGSIVVETPLRYEKIKKLVV